MIIGFSFLVLGGPSPLTSLLRGERSWKDKRNNIDCILSMEHATFRKSPTPRTPKRSQWSHRRKRNLPRSLPRSLPSLLTSRAAKRPARLWMRWELLPWKRWRQSSVCSSKFDFLFQKLWFWFTHHYCAQVCFDFPFHHLWSGFTYYHHFCWHLNSFSLSAIGWMDDEGNMMQVNCVN